MNVSLVLTREAIIGYLVDVFIIDFHIQISTDYNVPATDRLMDAFAALVGRLYGLTDNDVPAIIDIAFDVFRAHEAGKNPDPNHKAMVADLERRLEDFSSTKFGNPANT